MLSAPLSPAAPALRSGSVPYTLCSLGLEWQTERSLRGMLDLLGQKTRTRWAYVDDFAVADVVIYEPGNALAQAMVRRADGKTRRKVFVACTTQADGDPLSLRIPVGPTRLMAVLDAAAERLGGLAETPAGQSSLCELLDGSLQSPDTAGLAVVADGETGFISGAHRGVYWPRPLTAVELTSILLNRARFTRIPGSDTAQATRVGEVAPQMISWDGVMWAIGVNTSAGRLLRRLDPRGAYRLTRWPDFGVIGRRSAEMKCTALLSQRAFSPDGLAAITGLPQTTVNNFFNACALCGLLRVDPSAPTRAAVPAPGPQREASLLGGVLRRLRQAFALDGDA